MGGLSIAAQEKQERSARLLDSALTYKRQYFDTHKWRSAGMFWSITTHTDPVAKALFAGHYSCRRSCVTTVAGPGEKLVLIRKDALFVWTKERYRQDGQTGVNCAAFRNIGPILSSSLIWFAMRIAWCKWPGERLFTFIDPRQVKSTNPGYCYKEAGWRKCGMSAKGLIIMEAYPE